MKTIKKEVTIQEVKGILNYMYGVGSNPPLMNQLLDPIVKYQLHKFGKVLNAELEIFEKVRVELIKKHGEEDKKTGSWSCPEDHKNYKSFLKEINPLIAQKIEVDVPKLTISDFKKIQSEFDFSPFIEFMIE